MKIVAGAKTCFLVCSCPLGMGAFMKGLYVTSKGIDSNPQVVGYFVGGENSAPPKALRRPYVAYLRNYEG